jgi:hypothetical protein
MLARCPPQACTFPASQSSSLLVCHPLCCGIDYLRCPLYNLAILRCSVEEILYTVYTYLCHLHYVFHFDPCIASQVSLNEVVSLYTYYLTQCPRVCGF